MTVNQSPATVEKKDHRPYHSPSPWGEGRGEGGLYLRERSKCLLLCCSNLPALIETSKRKCAPESGALPIRVNSLIRESECRFLCCSGVRNSRIRLFGDSVANLHSKLLKTHLIKVHSHLITVNHTQSNIFRPPSPTLSNLKQASHCPIWIYRFGQRQKSARFHREKTWSKT
jgi:hypothetical protein